MHSKTINLRFYVQVLSVLRGFFSYEFSSVYRRQFSTTTMKIEFQVPDILPYIHRNIHNNVMKAIHLLLYSNGWLKRHFTVGDDDSTIKNLFYPISMKSG